LPHVLVSTRRTSGSCGPEGCIGLFSVDLCERAVHLPHAVERKRGNEKLAATG
jgi:hypothetical protein